MSIINKNKVFYVLYEENKINSRPKLSIFFQSKNTGDVQWMRIHFFRCPFSPIDFSARTKSRKCHQPVLKS